LVSVKKRGRIESLVDDVLTQKEILSGIKWLHDEGFAKSPEDLALGYIIGCLKSIATLERDFRVLSIIKKVTLKESKADKEINKILRRRLPEINEAIARELNR